MSFAQTTAPPPYTMAANDKQALRARFVELAGRQSEMQRLFGDVAAHLKTMEPDDDSAPLRAEWKEIREVVLRVVHAAYCSLNALQAYQRVSRDSCDNARSCASYLERERSRCERADEPDMAFVHQGLCICLRCSASRL
ncbi:hypothetical protein AcV5_007282 [Taiwanofungus camphoratus]|nr:hypothetical protein AcV5_007282 [Antrodia cinnamomea]